MIDAKQIKALTFSRRAARCCASLVTPELPPISSRCRFHRFTKIAPTMQLAVMVAESKLRQSQEMCAAK
jgi:hypothetical protein